MDVAADGEASGGFAADDCVGFGHLGGDVFEADGDFIAFLAEFLRYLVEHVGGADVADDGALPAFIFYQVVVEEHHDVVGVKEFSFVVNDAKAVGIAVGGYTDVAFSVQDEILEGAECCRGGGGKLAAEKRIVAFMDGVNFASGRKQYGLDGGFAYAVHGVKGDFKPAVADGLHINVVYNIVQVFVQGIDFLNQSGFQGFVVFHGLYFLVFDPGRMYFSISPSAGAGVPASLR